MPIKARRRSHYCFNIYIKFKYLLNIYLKYDVRKNNAYCNSLTFISLSFSKSKNEIKYTHIVHLGGRGASVSACGGLTNHLLSSWVDPRIAWKKH